MSADKSPVAGLFTARLDGEAAKEIDGIIDSFSAIHGEQAAGVLVSFAMLTQSLLALVNHIRFQYGVERGRTVAHQQATFLAVMLENTTLSDEVRKEARRISRVLVEKSQSHVLRKHLSDGGING